MLGSCSRIPCSLAPDTLCCACCRIPQPSLAQLRIETASIRPTASPAKNSLVYFISIVCIDHLVWGSHREEAQRGPPSGPRITRNEGAMRSLLLPYAPPGVSRIAGWCLLGATPRGQPRTPAVRLPHGCEGLRMRRMTVLWTFHRPCMGRPVPRQCMHNAWLDVTTIVPATASHRRSYAERHSKQHLDSLRRKDSLRGAETIGAETTEISVRLENYFASHFEGSASRYRPGKRNTQQIERTHLTRTRITRLGRQTICFSKTMQLPVFSANIPPVHARETGRKSFPEAALRADGEVRSTLTIQPRRHRMTPGTAQTSRSNRTNP